MKMRASRREDFLTARTTGASSREGCDVVCDEGAHVAEASGAALGGSDCRAGAVMPAPGVVGFPA